MVEVELIEQLRGVFTDMLDNRPNRGVVSKAGPRGIEVRLSTTGAILRDVNVIGGAASVAEGDPVYLLYFQDGAVLAAGLSGGFGSAAQSAAGASGAHDHGARYYTRSQMDARLVLKSDHDHVHPAPSWINAEGGTLGGFTIDSDAIRAQGVVLHGRNAGWLGLGAPPPASFGSIRGAWLGFDTSTSADAEGTATPALAPKLSLYQNASNYFQWTGARLLIRAENFRLKGDGTIEATNGAFSGQVTATSGHIAGWAVAAGRLYSGAGGTRVELNSQAAQPHAFWAGAESAAAAPFRVTKAGQLVARHADIAGHIVAQSGHVTGTLSVGGLMIDGAKAEIRSANFTSDYAGILLRGLDGYAEFGHVKIRGEMHAATFVKDEVHAVGGTLLVLTSATLAEDVMTL
jgi:hypothetical protein